MRKTEREITDWDLTCFKKFNNCYILLLNSPQTLEKTEVITGELSLIVSLVLYRPPAYMDSDKEKTRAKKSYKTV